VIMIYCISVIILCSVFASQDHWQSFHNYYRTLTARIRAGDIPKMSTAKIGITDHVCFVILN